MRTWSDQQLKNAVKESQSIRSVLKKLKLVPAGGNYVQVKKRIGELEISTIHFTGKAWLRGKSRPYTFGKTLKQILNTNSHYQSFKLKKRLFKEGYKTAECEECGWNKKAPGGRVPVELDHINGDPSDNRINNLRVLCPNCHSLKPTHRGKNKKLARVA